MQNTGNKPLDKNTVLINTVANIGLLIGILAIVVLCCIAGGL